MCYCFLVQVMPTFRSGWQVPRAPQHSPSLSSLGPNSIEGRAGPGAGVALGVFLWLSSDKDATKSSWTCLRTAQKTLALRKEVPWDHLCGSSLRQSCPPLAPLQACSSDSPPTPGQEDTYSRSPQSHCSSELSVSHSCLASFKNPSGYGDTMSQALSWHLDKQSPLPTTQRVPKPVSSEPCVYTARYGPQIHQARETTAQTPAPSSPCMHNPASYHICDGQGRGSGLSALTQKTL